MSFPKLRRVTAPAALPVTLAEVKAHLRVLHPDEDAMIQSYLAAVVCELDGKDGELFRCLAPQVWEQEIIIGPSPTALPLGPVNAATVTVEYLDDTGGRVPLSSSAFAVTPAAGTDDAYIKWLAGAPSGRTAFVRFDAGEGAIEPAIKAAILLLTEDLYNGRDAAPARERTIANLLRPYKRDIVVD